MPTTPDTLNPVRELSLLREALCCCWQTRGRHASDCPSSRVSGQALGEALARHDHRLLAATEEFCTSCGEAVDPDNLCRVNGLSYHLGNCPRPHGAPDAEDH